MDIRTKAWGGKSRRGTFDDVGNETKLLCQALIRSGEFFIFV